MGKVIEVPFYESLYFGRSLLSLYFHFVLHQVLLIGKAVAAVLSGSLSVITSVIDSAVDLVSGILMWCSGRAVKRKDPYRYPQGHISSTSVCLYAIQFDMCIELPSMMSLRKWCQVWDCGTTNDTSLHSITTLHSYDYRTTGGHVVKRLPCRSLRFDLRCGVRNFGLQNPVCSTSSQ